jgi:hypothetical protein
MPDVSESRRLPELTAVEGDAYVFTAALADPTIDGDPNWLVQTLRVDPTTQRSGDLVVRVVERYHVSGEAPHVAFEDRFTVRVPVGDDASPRRVPTVRRALERWYRRAYPDADDTDDTGRGSAPG